MLKIQELDVDTLIPYEKNPRKNKKAVEAVAASIEQFGFQQPVVVDKDLVVIVGHTRLSAAKKLKMKRVPVVVADNLTPAQVKAYRLADNRVGEISVWDGTRLELELVDLAKINFDMKPFNFPEIKLDVETGKAVKEDFETHREKTWRHDNFELFLSVPDDEKTPEWGFPVLPPVDVKPEHGMIAFSEMLASKEFDAGVHFFVDDYRFERAWVSPDKYAPHLAKHPFIIQPDFSTYTDMPKVMQMWNKWRNHMLAWHWSNLGISVVPNVMFSDEASYEWVFDGMPQHSTICISNVGVMQNKAWREAFIIGMEEAIKRLSPLRILFYGKIPNYDFKGIEVMEFKTNSFRGKKKDEV